MRTTDPPVSRWGGHQVEIEPRVRFLAANMKDDPFFRTATEMRRRRMHSIYSGVIRGAGGSLGAERMFDCYFTQGKTLVDVAEIERQLRVKEAVQTKVSVIIRPNEAAKSRWKFRGCTLGSPHERLKRRQEYANARWYMPERRRKEQMGNEMLQTK